MNEIETRQFWGYTKPTKLKVEIVGIIPRISHNTFRALDFESLGTITNPKQENKINEYTIQDDTHKPMPNIIKL